MTDPTGQEPEIVRMAREAENESDGWTALSRTPDASDRAERVGEGELRDEPEHPQVPPGYVVVPEVPTEAMLDAGANAVNTIAETGGEESFESDAAIIYSAMVRAGCLEPKDTP